MKTFRIFPLVLIFCLVLAFAAPGACALDAPELNGKAALIIDLDSGEVLYELNKDQQRAPASLTKIMTMLVALEALDRGQFTLEDIVTAQADCLTGLAEDSSNAGEDYSRNRIRHRVTPVLREINPAFSSAALRTAELMRRDEDCLSAMAEEFIRENFDGESLPLVKLRALHPAVAGRVFRQLCPETLSLEQVDELMKLAKGNELSFADLPGIRLRFEQGRLSFGQGEKTLLPERVIVPGTVTPIPEAGLKIQASIENFSEEINSKFKTYLFKCESICGNITCDSRRPGDKISPVGRNCTKSLKNLFLEAGMTQRERDLTPVIRDEKGVIAVCGLAVDRRCEAKPGDKVLRLDIEREN